MLNELLFIGAALVNLLFILGAAHYGRAGLVLSMTLCLVLVATFGPKLVSVFGVLTNVGVIFYGALVLATNLLVERYGTRAGHQAVWVAFAGNLFFVLMGQFALRFLGDAQTAGAHEAIFELFSITPHIALASMLAYLVSQHLNVYCYGLLKERTQLSLWKRHVTSVSLVQAIDSAIFFTVAFWGTLSGAMIVQTLILGGLLKIGIGVVSTPGMYAGRTIPLESLDDHEDTN